MKTPYLLGILLAVVIVIGGIILLGRDGTEKEVQGLPINKEVPVVEEVVSKEPVIESNVSDDAPTEESTELPETATSTEEIEKVDDAFIVTYTEQGFSPKQLKIEQGDTVRFVNNHTRNMWVGSNVHPTHTQYPEQSDDDCLGSSFDMCSGFASGKTWEFTFVRIGEWGYHDHLNASRTGTIIVE